MLHLKKITHKRQKRWIFPPSLIISENCLKTGFIYAFSIDSKILNHNMHYIKTLNVFPVDLTKYT